LTSTAAADAGDIVTEGWAKAGDVESKAKRKDESVKRKTGEAGRVTRNSGDR
jgi:hypothetical protein